ncbi:pyridoxamine 5'-phosphate oxidase family protein [Asticcacaulis sp. AC460]|uniref:pyridoxamine 5'-phosphate oxidase family protein n=1 Tax=Asticcacaulis sp. AC460 TaxID=1282360 RepID=UPI0004217662|nr:pyridoxamine 5'-phosphate oxidase family protein [Asticcacaulis sp. AC460]
MTLSLHDISKTMRDIDLCMLTSKTVTGELEARPMSNNRKVDWDGDTWFFADGGSSAAQEIAANPEVNLAYSREPGLLTKPFFLSVTGHAELVNDRAEMEKHWNKDIELWFKDGLDTPGLVMIHVKADRLKYWDGMEEGELRL